MATAAMGFTACKGGNGDNNNAGVDSTAIATVDSTIVQEVTGVVVDGARRNIDLQVDDDTLNFELPSDIDASWQIGDTLTLRYYLTRENGDSVVEVIDHQQ